MEITEVKQAVKISINRTSFPRIYSLYSLTVIYLLGYTEMRILYVQNGVHGMRENVTRRNEKNKEKWKLVLLETLKQSYQCDKNKVLLLGIVISYFIRVGHTNKSLVRQEFEHCRIEGINYYKVYVDRIFRNFIDIHSTLYQEVNGYTIENKECILKDGQSVFELLERYEYCNEEFLEEERTITPTIVAWLMDELTVEEDRKKRGIYYTNPTVVKQMCETCLNSFAKEGKEPEGILDPAVGDGEFLIGMLQVLGEKSKGKDVTCSQRVARQLYGVDISPTACLITIFRLYMLCQKEENAPCSFYEHGVFAHHIVLGDTLGILNNVEKVQFNTLFSIVIGNPPYIDSETMKLLMPEARKKATKQYESAVGNWDMFVLFVERAVQLAKEDGRVHLLIPNRILYAEYSQKIRNILHNLQVIEIMDYSSQTLFDQAAVYPISILVKKSQEKRNVTICKNYGQLQDKIEISAPLFYEDTNWQSFFSMEESEQSLMNKLGDNKKLYELASVESAGSVRDAYAIKELLVEQSEAKGIYYKAVNTGTIDPFESLWGIKKMQYIKQSYLTPIVDQEQLYRCNKKRYEQAKRVKLILGGLNKRLECIYDEGKLLPCKSTIVICKKNLALQYLCGLLNSRILTYYYSHNFHGCRVANGFYYIGVKQIGMLPIAIGDEMQQLEVINCVIILENERIGVEQRCSTQNRLNHIIAQIYGLTTEEEVKIEQKLQEENHIGTTKKAYHK